MRGGSLFLWSLGVVRSSVVSVGARCTKLALHGPLVIKDSNLAGGTRQGGRFRGTNTNTVMLGSLFRRRVRVRDSVLVRSSSCPRTTSCVHNCMGTGRVGSCLRLVRGAGRLYAVPIVTDVGYCGSST